MTPISKSDITEYFSQSKFLVIVQKLNVRVAGVHTVDV